MKLLKILIATLLVFLLFDAVAFCVSQWFGICKELVNDSDNDQSSIPALTLCLSVSTVAFGYLARYLRLHKVNSPAKSKLKSSVKDESEWKIKFWKCFKFNRDSSEQVLTKLKPRRKLPAIENEQGCIDLKKAGPVGNQIPTNFALCSGDGVQDIHKEVNHKPQDPVIIYKDPLNCDSIGCKIEVNCQCNMSKLENRVQEFEGDFKDFKDLTDILTERIERTESDIRNLNVVVTSLDDKVRKWEPYLEKNKVNNEKKKHPPGAISQLSALIAETRRQFEDEEDFIKLSQKATNDQIVTYDVGSLNDSQSSNGTSIQNRMGSEKVDTLPTRESRSVGYSLLNEEDRHGFPEVTVYSAVGQPHHILNDRQCVQSISRNTKTQMRSCPGVQRSTGMSSPVFHRKRAEISPVSHDTTSPENSPRIPFPNKGSCPSSPQKHGRAKVNPVMTYRATTNPRQLPYSYQHSSMKRQKKSLSEHDP